MLRVASHRIYLARTFGRNVDASGYFENQLVGGTYMTFDQSISGIRVQSICTNFDGVPTFGSYIKINGTVVASDWTLAPDGTDNRANVGTRMTRGHTVVILNPSGVVQSTTVYDTWNGSGEACVPMAAALQAIPAEYFVAIGTYDATSCLQVLRDVFTNYFGDTDYTNTWTPQRRSQMFLAVVKKKILTFNGSSNRIQVGGTIADWNLAYSWTIEFWSKAAVSTASGTLITVMSQAPDNPFIDLYYQNGYLSFNNGTTLCAEPTPGVWTHVAIVTTAAGAGGTKVYYNGVSVSGITAGGQSIAPFTAYDLWIGRRGNNNFQYFNGKLTNIRISNTPRYSTTFTPPLTLVTDANTRLALDGNLVDRSASAHTITNTGTSTSNLDFPT